MVVYKSFLSIHISFLSEAQIYKYLNTTCDFEKTYGYFSRTGRYRFADLDDDIKEKYHNGFIRHRWLYEKYNIIAEDKHNFASIETFESRFEIMLITRGDISYYGDITYTNDFDIQISYDADIDTIGIIDKIVSKVIHGSRVIINRIECNNINLHCNLSEIPERYSERFAAISDAFHNSKVK